MQDTDGPWVEIVDQTNVLDDVTGKNRVRAFVKINDFGGEVTTLALVEIERDASQQDIENALLSAVSERLGEVARYSTDDLRVWLKESQNDA